MLRRRRFHRAKAYLLLSGLRHLADAGTSTATTARLPADRDLGLADPWVPKEDDIDAEVRADLDRWERAGRVRSSATTHRAGRRRPARKGAGGARPLRRAPAAALRADRGRHARRRPMDGAQRAVTCLNLGLLHPLECVQAAESAYRDGAAPLASVEGYIPPRRSVLRPLAVRRDRQDRGTTLHEVAAMCRPRRPRDGRGGTYRRTASTEACTCSRRARS